MSKKSIFDINKIVCPICGKTHIIKRKEFDSYYFDCYVHEKTFYIKINNLIVNKDKYWAKWMNYTTDRLEQT